MNTIDNAIATLFGEYFTKNDLIEVLNSIKSDVTTDDNKAYVDTLLLCINK